MMHGELYSVEKLGTVLESDDPKVLILDCRSPNDFNTSHIKGALHVLIPNLMLRRLKKGNLNVASVIGAEGKDRFVKSWKEDLVVLYDENTRSKEANPSSVLSLLLNKLSEDGCRACLLQGGFDAFKLEFPQHCAGNQGVEDSTIIGLSNLNIQDSCDKHNKETKSPNPNSTNVFPVQVIPYLFLGNAKNSEDMDCLRKHGISYVVNVTPNVENKFEDNENIKYLQIPIDDHWSQPISHFFPKAIQFIDEGRHAGCGVLVHCLAGISRSVTVTVAYLMCALNLSLNEAYDYVKTKKSNISPNFNFMGQLLDFEKSLQVKDCGCSCPKENASEGVKASSSSSEEESNTTHLPCPCSCHQLKSYFSTPSSTSSSSSTSSGPQFSYNIPPTPS